MRQPVLVDRPPRWEERIADALLSLGAPRVQPVPALPPDKALHPYDARLAPRRHAEGVLDTTWYPPTGDPRDMRGAVLLCPPWVDWGQAYFHRRGRIEALREAGYGALTFDLGGFGRTTPTRGFRDRDVHDALDELARRAPDVPHHLWGVSSGGHWSHAALAVRSGVAGAVFEDVTPHLFEWRVHMGLPGRHATDATRRILPRADRFMDARNHAPHLRVRATAYVAGGNDPGIPVSDAHALARSTNGRVLVIEEAGHLQAIKLETRRVIDLALSTFERAERDG